MNILIAGGSQTVYFLTRGLTGAGHRVTVACEDRSEAERLAARLRVTVVHGDPTDPSVLGDAGAATSDAVVAAMPTDHANLAVCHTASVCYHVPRVLAVIADPDGEELFEAVGIAYFSATRLLAELIEHRTVADGVSTLLALEDGGVVLSEVVLSTASPVAGRALHELKLPEGSLIACLVREGRPIVPRGGTELAPGDRLVVISVPEELGAALSAIAGSERS